MPLQKLSESLALLKSTAITAVNCSGMKILTSESLSKRIPILKFFFRINFTRGEHKGLSGT